MFWPDVVEIKRFYATSLGKITQDVVSASMLTYWKDLRSDETLLGIGYATPYLNALSQQSGESVVAFMPAAQGIEYWPSRDHNHAILGFEGELPFADNTVNRIILAHILENTDASAALMREIYRVLVPGGRLIAIAPNRRGIWSRMDITPFGHGRPYSRSQLRRLFSKHELTPAQVKTVLYMPPSHSKLLQKLWRLMENIGERTFSIFGGIIIMEVEKLLYATHGKRERKNASALYGQAASGAALPTTSPLSKKRPVD